MRALFLALALSFTLPLMAADKTKLALNWKPEPEFGGFYAAEASGAYKKHGLEVEIMPGGSGTPVVQMIAAGKVDFGIVSADEAVISQANGSDVVALFAVFQTNPQGVMAHADRGFKSVGDILKSDGTTVLWDGSVGTATSNVIVATVSFVSGATLSISSLTMTLPMQGA